MTAVIRSVKCRQIFDSRGNPTVEVDVCCSDGTFARAAAPSGASTGVYEALELRDGGSDYFGKGVLKAVDNVNSIIGPALIGKDPTEQTQIDNFMVHELDGTRNQWGWCKQKLGANAILAVSLAVCKAGASVKKIPLYRHIANLAGNNVLVLPVPAFNVINGGQCAGNKLAMQEFMILPTGAKSFKEAMKMGVEVYHVLKSLIKKKYGQDASNVGDEGGFAPNIQENNEALELLKTAIEIAGYTGKVVIGVSAGASQFYNNDDQTYDLNFKEENNDGSQKISGDSLKNMYDSLSREYPIVSIVDPFDKGDWLHYSKLTKEFGRKLQVVGDDLLNMNPTTIEKAIAEKSCNAIVLKINQIGSVTESIEVFRMCNEDGWGMVTSHRSGETEDTFIADLAVGLSTGQIKTGAPCRSEHTAKYNQLLRIEEDLGAESSYAGSDFRTPTWGVWISSLLYGHDSDEEAHLGGEVDIQNQSWTGGFVFSDYVIEPEYAPVGNTTASGGHDDYVIVRKEPPYLIDEPPSSDEEIEEEIDHNQVHGLNRNCDSNAKEPPYLIDEPPSSDEEIEEEIDHNQVHGLNRNCDSNALLITGADEVEEASGAGQQGNHGGTPPSSDEDIEHNEVRSNRNYECGVLLLTRAGEVEGASGVGQQGIQGGSSGPGIEILKLPANFNGDAPLDRADSVKMATAEILRRAVNECADWLPKQLLAALLFNGNIFAVDRLQVAETDFKKRTTGVVLVLTNEEYLKVEPTHCFYTSKHEFVLRERKPTMKKFDGTDIMCFHFGGDSWTRRRWTLANNRYHVLQWLPPDRHKVKGARPREKNSLESCVQMLLQMEELTEEEQASAMNLMKSEQNRIIFVALRASRSVQVLWLRGQLALQEGPV